MIVSWEGFDSRAVSTALTGWVNGPPAVSTNAHQGPGGFGGDRSGQFSQTSGNRYLPFKRWNNSAGRRYRAREVHINGAHAASSDSRTNPVLLFEGGNTLSGFRWEGQRVYATRGLTGLGSAAFAYNYDAFYTFKCSTYVDTSAGEVLWFNGDDTTPTLSATGQNTQGSAANYADGWGLTGQNFQAIAYLDDFMIYVPSVIIEIGSGAVSVGDSITIGSATMTVSDVDTSPTTPITPSGGGTIARLVVHRWNGTTFADGASVTGGTLSGTTARVPNASFQGGFEPWSWPQYTRVIGRFLVLNPWGGDGTVNLTAVGSVNHYENVDSVPPSTSDYNEATSGANLADTYDTPGALPAGTGAIEAVCVRVACDTAGTYTTLRQTLTDGSGSQVSDRTLPNPADAVGDAYELDSALAEWGTTLPTSGTYELRT